MKEDGVDAIVVGNEKFHRSGTGTEYPAHDDGKGESFSLADRLAAARRNRLRILFFPFYTFIAAARFLRVSVSSQTIYATTMRLMISAETFSQLARCNNS